MAGHSKFANIKHRKGAQDAQRAKKFTKLVKEVIVSVKIGGPDAQGNARLRSAIASAKSANVPKDKIEAAIKKASGSDDTTNYEEIRYEGYGPSGIPVIIECLSDNRNRTASDVRSALTKSGGSLGETGSVSFMFEKCGVITYSTTQALTADQLTEVAIELGVDDCIEEEGFLTLKCPMSSFHEMKLSLIEKVGEPVYAEITWLPNDYADANEEIIGKVFNLIEKLEDLDDVQNVFTNLPRQYES